MWAPVIWIATLPQRPVGQQMVPMLATNGTSGAVRQPGSQRLGQGLDVVGGDDAYRLGAVLRNEFGRRQQPPHSAIPASP